MLDGVVRTKIRFLIAGTDLRTLRRPQTSTTLRIGTKFSTRTASSMSLAFSERLNTALMAHHFSCSGCPMPSNLARFSIRIYLWLLD